MKKNILLAMVLAALVSCSSDDFVGEKSLQEAIGTGGAISFGMSTPTVTRAKTGSEAATDLNRNFVVYGYKTVSSTPSTVFDNYQVNYANASGNSAGSTESNSAGWEYVSYKNLPSGVTTNVGVTAFSALTGSGQANESAIDQSIKYWDFSASAYDFFAYSLGKGVTESSTTTWAKASALSNSTYTLEGSKGQLGTCYISKKKTITPSSSSATEVDLEFISFLSKIQLKFFETIPGYSVKDVKFYTADNTKSTGTTTNDGLAPALYTVSTIPTDGKYTITFDDNNDPVVTLTTANSTETSISFPVAETGTPEKWLSGLVGKEYRETDETVYLGRAANAATASKQITVLPNSTGAIMTLKVDYTLVSRDGSGETIQVTGATATIPADYAKWKPNYVYTYIFKISDNTNGQTYPGTGNPVGLYPITLDAEVITDASGTQTTITTVDTPSITTYQNATVANEYNAGNIYVVVNNGTTLTVSGSNINAKLYTATITGTTPAQGITEESVANALAQGGSVTDAQGATLAVTEVNTGSDVLALIPNTGIPATDAPGGKALIINGAYFTAIAPSSGTKYYVFEYIDGSNKYYKVIKVVAP